MNDKAIVATVEPMKGWHPRSNFVQIGGVACHFVDLPGPSATAPVLVLLHGVAVSSWNWRFNLARLSRRFRLIVPCQKGFGWSGRQGHRHGVADLGAFVLALLDHLEIHRFSVCGSSLGGTVSLWLTQGYPDRVQQLVLVNPAALTDQRPWHLLHTQVPALAPLYRKLLGPTIMRAGLTALAYRNLRVDARYMAGFWTPMMRRGSMKVMLEVARDLPRSLPAIEAGLEHLDLPILIIWGEKDGVLPIRGARQLLRRLLRAPTPTLIIFERCGHCPHEENPERFDDVVGSFLIDSI